MSRIRTCPHCGGSACLNANYSYKTRKYFVFVKCDICGSQGKVYRSDLNPSEENWDNTACNDAIKAWNMRNDTIQDIDEIDLSQINLRALLYKIFKYDPDLIYESEDE